MARIKVGSVVRLKAGERMRRGHPQATVVQGFLTGIKGGVALADCLEGIRFWNVEALEICDRFGGKL